MRILRVVSGKDTGGIFTCEMQFIRELKSRNYIVDAIIVGEGVNSKEYQNICNTTYNLPALNYSYGGGLFSIINAMYKTRQYGFKYAAYLKTQIKDNVIYDAIIYQKPTLIHIAGKLAKLLNTKCLWHLPNIVRTTISKAYYNYYCNQYGITPLANSIFTQKTLGEICQFVVYPGYDKVRVQEDEPIFRHKLKIKETAPIYGIAARMQENKAQDIVVKAFVNSNIPAAGGHLIIAGGPLDTEFSKKVQQEAGTLLNKQIHFLGEMRDMPKFYASVDVIINGRKNVEPFGISVAEAFGAGKPVMAYYLGGPSEMIKNKINGWLVKEATVKSYTAVFNESLEDRNRWELMGNNAKTNSYEFSVENNVDKLIKIIKTSQVL